VHKMSTRCAPCGYLCVCKLVLLLIYIHTLVYYIDGVVRISLPNFLSYFVFDCILLLQIATSLSHPISI